MSETVGVVTLLALALGLAGVGLAVWLAFVRARRAEAKLGVIENMLKSEVMPYLERRVRRSGGATSRGPAVILGPDGSIVVTGELGVAHEIGRLVAHLEKIEEADGAALAMSDTEQFDSGATAKPKS